MTVSLLYGLHNSIMHTTAFSEPHSYTSIRVVWAISILASYSTSILSLVFTVTRNRNHMRNMLSIISCVDSKLLHKHLKQSVYMQQRSHILRQLMVMLILHISVSVLCELAFYSGTWMCFVYSVSQNLATVTNTVVILQYVNIVLIVKRRYQYIRHLLSEAAFTDDFCTSTHMYAGHPVILDSDALFLSSGYEVTDRDACNVCPIQVLQIIYSDLYDVLHANSKTYGILILLNIMAILTNTVQSMYFAVILIKEALMNDADFYVCLKGATLLSASFFDLLIFIWLTICCQSTADEVQDTIVCIQKLLLRPNRPFWSTEDLKRLLSQLKNLKVEFSVCGFFSLNLQLLSGSVGVIITYIFVLNQFN
ncbi:hypothetical protein B7P43_G13506 [Cryptotermes secundus]|uniref:Gustatory receptor n=1 Tax=Cryptotermes secundus TaxID=105785 RepID=A0A2J7PYQ3_9NEOP|nr:hypothetical protein B7P43_G13506 [Cryptotermes secundus]